ncbi:putative immunity protein [Actinomycetospora sp. NBRC 106378]|uniref:putative immunity protein n=1 Tax=Actinomycetospora sp. NBRC 106378 TaxID=3032208 RepID=UPI002556959E|nr:exonuclease SbcC [Actinomycetospora sp. NBRC 106378]
MELTLDELRAVATFAAACARPVLPLFEASFPDDGRPRLAIAAAAAFAEGGPRTKAMRDGAWGAQRAASGACDAGSPVAEQAARSALAAAGAGYLHPLPDAAQVRHVLGAAAHALRARELAGDPAPVAATADLAGPVVRTVLQRYPAAPAGGGRIGELMRALDAAVRDVGS